MGRRGVRDHHSKGGVPDPPLHPLPPLPLGKSSRGVRGEPQLPLEFGHLAIHARTAPMVMETMNIAGRLRPGFLGPDRTPSTLQSQCHPGVWGCLLIKPPPPGCKKTRQTPHRALEFAPGVEQFWGKPFRPASCCPPPHVHPEVGKPGGA